MEEYRFIPNLEFHNFTVQHVVQVVTLLNLRQARVRAVGVVSKAWM